MLSKISEIYSKPSLIRIALYQWQLKTVQIAEFVRITESVLIYINRKIIQLVVVVRS